MTYRDQQRRARHIGEMAKSPVADVKPGEIPPMIHEPDTIERQLQERLRNFDYNLIPPSLRNGTMRLALHRGRELAEEAAKLRRLCRKVYSWSKYWDPEDETVAKLRAAAEGKEIQ